MSNLKTCSRCNSTLDKSFFGVNRKKQLYKTCVTCRGKPAKQTDTKKNDVDQVENEIAELYRKEFNIDYRDTSFAYFSEQEQIERYAANLAFWQRLKRQCGNDNLYNRRKYIEDMHGRLVSMLFFKFAYRPQMFEAILDRLDNLMDDGGC